MPGTYTVTMSSIIDGVTTDLGRPQEFEVVELGINTFKADDPAEVHAFQQKVSDLERAFRGAVKWATDAESRIAHTRKALFDTPDADTAHARRVADGCRPRSTTSWSSSTVTRRGRTATSSRHLRSRSG